MLLKIVRPSELYELIQRRTSTAIAPASHGKAWRMAVILSGEETVLKKTRFAKSIAEEIDAPDKVQNFITLANALVHASNSENYHQFFNDYPVACKEAHAFTHERQRVKILELKRMRKKERLYFYAHVGRNANMKFFVPLLAAHKRDEGTPTSIADHCESQVSQLLNSTNLKVLE
jgi:hypothetical protein